MYRLSASTGKMTKTTKGSISLLQKKPKVDSKELNKTTEKITPQNPDVASKDSVLQPSNNDAIQEVHGSKDEDESKSKCVDHPLSPQSNGNLKQPATSDAPTVDSNTSGSIAISDLSIGENSTAADSVTNDSVCNDSVRGKPSACVFVASLSSVKTDDELSISVTKHFQQWGKLGTVKVLRDTCNRPYAFVQYCNDADCRNAIEKGHNSSLDGRTIRCEAAKVNRTLFVQTPKIVSETIIRNQLTKFGEIESLIPCNRIGVTNNSSSSKFWYCKFAFRDDAIKAFASLTEENKFEVDWTQNIDENHIVNERKIDKFSVFVGQLTSDVDEADLRKRFERHGKIERINIFRKEKSSFAFIRFETESGAAGAVERENHSMFNGKTVHIQYREIQVPSKFITNPFGVPLAPPPISLNRKLKYEQPRFRGPLKYNRGVYFSRPQDGSLIEQDINVENRKPGGSRDLKPCWNYSRRKDQFYESGRRDKFYFSKRYNRSGPRYDPCLGSNYFYVPGELNEANRGARFATTYYQPYYIPPYYEPNPIDET